MEATKRFGLGSIVRRYFNISENTRELRWTRTSLYRQRLGQVKTGWIFAGISMLISGTVPAVMVMIFFFSLFTSFAFLEPDDDFGDQ